MSEQYFAKKPSSSEEIYRIKARLRNKIFELYTASGVFSKKKVDYGTRLLVNEMILKKSFKKILDLGCGIGVIGVVCAVELPGSEIVLSDINSRAVKIARMNTERFDNTKVIQSDLFEKINELFDCILTNPPIRKGIDFNYMLIEECCEHLKQGGVLQLVARHNKGGSRLMEYMKKVFKNVTTIAKSGGYRIYISTKQ